MGAVVMLEAAVTLWSPHLNATTQPAELSRSRGSSSSKVRRSEHREEWGGPGKLI